MSEKPIYAASVSSLLFPSLNQIAEENYNPILAGVGLRPIPTAVNPTLQHPLATPQVNAQAAQANMQGIPVALDAPTTGADTQAELNLANLQNAVQARQALNGDAYSRMLGTELGRIAQQNMMARIAQNYQNGLYGNSLFDALRNSGLPEDQIMRMLMTAYATANSNAGNPSGPITGVMPYVAMPDEHKKVAGVPLDALPANVRGDVLAQAVLPTPQATSLPTIGLMGRNGNLNVPITSLEEQSPYLAGLPPALAQIEAGPLFRTLNGRILA